MAFLLGSGVFIGFIGVDSAFVLVYVDLYGLNK